MPMMTRRAATLLPFLLPIAARGEDAPVLIGGTYPLSGGVASAGMEMRAALEVGQDIVNNAHPELTDLPLGPTAGLPNLSGRKVQVTLADHQGNPATAQSQTLRLITQDHVVAMLGAYQSSCTLTSSAVAERYGIPFVAGESAAPSLTERGYKWFFRITPIGTDFGKAYAGFLDDLRGKDHTVDRVTVVNENTEYGTSTGDAIIAAFKEHKLQLASRIPYNANSADVSAEVLQMKQTNPDVVIFISYTSDFDPVPEDHEEPGLEAGHRHRRRFRVFRPQLRQGGGRPGPGRDQPQRLRHRQAGQLQQHRQRHVQDQNRQRHG